MGLVLRRPFADATSGLYAVNAKALPLLAEPFRTEAPEVEALLRLNDADLRVEEVPVEMKARASGDSKLRGRKALKVIDHSDRDSPGRPFRLGAPVALIRALAY